MDKRIIQNYRRFKDYTLKLAAVCLALAVISFFIFCHQRWIAGVCLIAAVSAYAHHAYLKIMLYYFDQKDK